MKQKILRECLRKAKLRNSPLYHPDWGSYHHFCFIVQENKIVKYGMNRTANAIPIHGFGAKRHKIHAEIDAYHKARRILNNKKTFEVVNIRLNRQNELRSAAPCAHCTSFLAFVGCSKTFYTTNSGFEQTGT